MLGMEAREIIQWMMSESGMSGVALSHAIGRSPNYMSATLSKGSTPQIDTFAKIAHAMGYEVVIRKKSEEVVYASTES